MPIFGKSKIGDSCFIDSTELIGFPHGAELNLLKENPYLKRLREFLEFMPEGKRLRQDLMQQKTILKELMSLEDNKKNS